MSAQIWAVGGGKGGTGKSFLITGLAIFLANLGKKVTIIDADLGGANLHSILKINKPSHSLTDFFENKVPLENIIEETGIPNLRLIIGDIATLTPDSVKYAQRLKLYRQIKHMSGDYVLIDLGAGTTMSTLDTFLTADKMITLTLPEITSIDNLYHFLKKALFRKLNSFLSDHELKDAAKKAWTHRQENDIKTIKHLVDHFKKISPDVKNIIETEFAHLNIFLVLNQVRHTPHIDVGASVKSIITKYFGIHAQYAGFLSYHEYVWKFVNEPTPLLRLPAGAPVLAEIANVAKNIMENKGIHLTDPPEGIKK